VAIHSGNFLRIFVFAVQYGHQSVHEAPSLQMMFDHRQAQCGIDGESSEAETYHRLML